MCFGCGCTERNTNTFRLRTRRQRFNLDKDLIEANWRLFNQFKHTKADPKVSNLKTASEIIYTLCKNELLEMVTEFVKVATILAVIPTT